MIFLLVLSLLITGIDMWLFIYWIAKDKGKKILDCSLEDLSDIGQLFILSLFPILNMLLLIFLISYTFEEKFKSMKSVTLREILKIKEKV